MSVDLTGDLFGAYLPPRARRKDPETSHAAAAQAQQFAGGHAALILLALKSYGPMTISEIAGRTGIDHVAVARRCSELALQWAIAVLVEDGVQVTRPGSSGRAQRVWRAA